MTNATSVMGDCFICGQPNRNSVCGSPEGMAHPECYYKRESERPRDAVITELRERITRLSRGLRQQTPCVICEWPRPYDNEHNICECCGFQEGYDSAEHYKWDGRWWAKNIDTPPLIVRRLADALQAIADSDWRGGAWCIATAKQALGVDGGRLESSETVEPSKPKGSNDAD